MRTTVVCLLLILFNPLLGVGAEEANQVTFAVGCYDVGADALKNRPGVLEVDKGWQRYDGFHFREVNRVRYDPQRVDVKRLEQWLKQADTWHATLPEQNEE